MRWADRLSRGVLSTVVCLIAIENVQRGGSPAPLGADDP